MGDEKKEQLQSKMVKDKIAEHAGHAGFRIRELSGGGIDWDCSCTKSKPKK